VRKEKPELAAKGVEEYDYVVGVGALQTARWRHGFLSAIPSPLRMRPARRSATTEFDASGSLATILLPN
jgi:hypothetical protein